MNCQEFFGCQEPLNDGLCELMMVLGLTLNLESLVLSTNHEYIDISHSLTQQ